MQPSRHSAFSLVELAIVLVILGLLAGAVLTGQALIHAAELRKVTTEAQSYTTAVVNFQEKYNALPGDFPGASRVWGLDCGTNDTTTSTGCNGNGDGIIATLVSAPIDENLKAWEHLSRAGLMDGSYDGTSVSGALTTTNIPASRYKSAYWDMNSFATATDTGFDQCPKNSVCLILGEIISTWTELGPLTHMTLEDSWNIDRKADDGYATSGNIRGDGDDSCLGTFAATDSTAPWGISNPYQASDTNICSMIFHIL